MSADHGRRPAGHSHGHDGEADTAGRHAHLDHEVAPELASADRTPTG